MSLRRNNNRPELQNLKALLTNSSAVQNMHDSDIAKILSSIKEEYEERFLSYIDSLPAKKLGGVLLELPDLLRHEILQHLSAEKLQIALEALQSDDATDLLEDLEKADEAKAEIVLGKINSLDREAINKIKNFEPHVAGAFMQTEAFDVWSGETIENALRRYRELKREGALENVHLVYVLERDGRFIDSIRLEELFLYDASTLFSTICKNRRELDIHPHWAYESAPIEEVAEQFHDYDLNAIAVVDSDNLFVGRITIDDIHDFIENRATKQMYNLAGVGGHGAELTDCEASSWRARAIWLLVNLGTMLLASMVISAFEETITQVVALAILMPIIPALSGNAGIQALTVTVRKLAIGAIDRDNAKKTIYAEMRIALLNGGSFSLLVGVISGVWFGDVRLGITMGLTVIAVLIVAGFLGSSIPMLLKHFGIDPAVGSSVVLTGILDSLAFFTLFGLASLLLIG